MTSGPNSLKILDHTLNRICVHFLMNLLSSGIRARLRVLLIITFSDGTLYCVGDAPCKRNQRIVVKVGLTFLFNHLVVYN